jgi:prevent-host-death family protein
MLQIGSTSLAEGNTVRKKMNPKAAAQPARQLVDYVQDKRAQGWTFALICREGRAGDKEHFPYALVQRIGKEYDARHGKPKQIIRTLAGTTHGTGATIIPVRDLRNQSARILRQVEAGQRFVITVSGRETAELGPVASSSAFIPISVVQDILREAPLDRGFARDLGAAVGQRVDEL